MIVLAVSGVMFLIAANFINGKQERTSFTQGVNEMTSRIQDTIEQINDGKYSDIPLNCSFNGVSVSFGGPTTAQGTNSTCVFLGKILHFSVSGVPHNYETLALAGGRVDASNNLSPTLTSVDPTVIAPLTTSQTTSQQLAVNNMSVTDSFGSIHNGNYAFGFAQGLGTANGVGNFQSGAQTISMVYAPVSSGMSDAQAVAHINGHVDYARSATICLTDGTQLARIVVGGTGTNNNQLSVNVQRINPGAPCP
jgi:hypothetical protein